MADSFFGFDTSISNINDDEGGGGPSEDEYDALNDETFGQDSEGFDWEVEHEQLAEQLESSRRHNASVEDHVHSLEVSLSQLVVDETDAPQSRTLGSSVWRHDAPFPAAPTPVPTLKNVCTVEELERQLRQKQQQQQQSFSQNYNFPPRYPPVILQRPPGLQAPVPLPFAPQQPMTHSQMTLNQMSQPLNNILSNNQLSQTNLMQNMSQMGQGVNQMGQNMNQMGQNVNQMGQNVNQMGQGVNQMGQNVNQMGQGVNQMGQNVNQMGQNVNQFMQNSNQMGFQNNQMAQNSMMNMSQSMQQHQMGQPNQMIGQNQMPQNLNQMSQNMNQMGQNVNQMGHNVNQMIPNGNQFNHNMNQFQMMSQQRMMAPPPGMTMPRQNFSPGMGQYNQPFRGPTIPSKLSDQQPQQMNHQNMLINQQMAQNVPTSVGQKPSNQQVNSQMNHNINQPISSQLNHMNHVSSQLSQSPQNKQQNQIQKIGNQNQIQNQKVDLKMQKSRTYNNSSQKNLTSQNLVQLIQNTHPMLQFNNSFHNASHHPMLNTRNNMFNNNNNQFTNQLLNNQRHNGTYSDNNRHMNGDGSSVSSDTDEYAGLMTAREKQWLINIQMLQLNTGTPYIHDFYYTVFLERQASKEKETVKEAHKANQQNHPFYSGAVKQEPMWERERHNSGRHNSCSEDGAPPRAYVPQQFENSLGKLQCGSVTAPRKIIDVELVSSEPSRTRAPSAASVTTPAEVPREMRRTKQLLLDIEALYLILLRLEELNDPLAISNALILKEREEKQKLADAALAETGAGSDTDCNVFLRNIESVQRRAKHECGRSEQDKRQVVNLAVNQKPPPVKNLLDEDKDDLINKMFLGLLQSDRLVQMMSVRKGRALISRFVSRVPATHCRLRALWSRVLRGLPHAARRDDSALAPLAARYALYIQNASGWQPVLESCSLLAEALDPARTPYALTTPFTLSCVCALIEKASQLTNTPEATSNERQWFKFLKTVARALKNATLTVAKPVRPLPEPKLLFHIKQLESRSTIEILQRGKTATEFADISKTDVSELLVKHLC